MSKLKVFYWDLCPHCQRMLAFLKREGVPFVALDIEKQPEEVVQKVIEINGGDDWVVPTLEYQGEWIPGRVFDEAQVRKDLKHWKLMD